MTLIKTQTKLFHQLNLASVKNPQLDETTNLKGLQLAAGSRNWRTTYLIFTIEYLGVNIILTDSTVMTTPAPVTGRGCSMYVQNFIKVPYKNT